MGKLALAFGAAAFAIGGVACLVPSFDDMGGDDAKAEPTPRTDESGDAATTTSASSSSGAGSSTSSSSGGSSAPTDAGPDAKPATFWCGSKMTECVSGAETCCGVFASTESVCRPLGNPGSCTGTVPCGGAADCGGVKACCYRGSVGSAGTGACEASCDESDASRYAYTICDPRKPICPGTTKCNGRIFGLAYCI